MELADVGRVESSVQPIVPDPHPDFAADQRLEAPHQFRGRCVVAGPNAPQEFDKIRVFSLGRGQSLGLRGFGVSGIFRIFLFEPFVCRGR
jgi:hypothetical protein